MNPWLMATGSSLIARYPIGALDDRSSVPTGRRPEPILSKPASVTFRSVSNSTGEDRMERSLA